MKKKIISLLLLGIMAITAVGCNNDTNENVKVAPGEPIVIEKSLFGNPIGGFDAEGKLTYGGDPAILVDGDTVYLYTGHDISPTSSYMIPEYQCYSTKDLINWTYEGVVMSMKDVKWGNIAAAWAGQVAKHYDETLKKDMYYLYFCSWDNTDSGKQSIGVAVSENPTGPFVDIGEPLVKGSFTQFQTSDWNDIDPTVWIEKDDKGVEHIYLMWGNSKLYGCELNADMVSVKDLNGDGKIKYGIDVMEFAAPQSFTEGPWLYRRQDENGNYYGPHYMFYAHGWREQLAYATTDAEDFRLAIWEFGGMVMSPSATSNTNHPAVFDFKGKTYLVYHNGSLPKGSGYRRVACIEEIIFDENGQIARLEETATGISGIISTIKNTAGEVFAHARFNNASTDTSYPYDDVQLGSNLKNSKPEDAYWEIVPGQADKANENYVSIESYNKAGLYVTADSESTVVLAQNHDGKMQDAQTFITVQGLNGEGVSFESVKFPGKYLTLMDGVASLTDGSNKDACSFTIETVQ